MNNNKPQFDSADRFVYGRRLLNILDTIRQDPEAMAKVKERVKENREAAKRGG